MERQRFMKQDNLDSVVVDEAPKAAMAVVINSDVWQDLTNHKKGCHKPTLVRVGQLTEEEHLRKIEAEKQATETRRAQFEQTALTIEHTPLEHQQQEQLQFDRGPAGGYMSEEAFRAECGCGANITITPAQNNTLDRTTDATKDAVNQNQLHQQTQDYMPNRKDMQTTETQQYVNTAVLSSQDNQPAYLTQQKATTTYK